MTCQAMRAFICARSARQSAIWETIARGVVNRISMGRLGADTHNATETF